MLIPLWVPWTVVAALAVTALFALEEHRRGQPDRGVDPWAVGRIWAATVVLAVGATWLTIDRLWVREDELLDAVDAAASLEEGEVASFSTDRLETAIADRLGHDVNIEMRDGRRSLDDAEVDYVVRVRSSDYSSSGPTVCLAVTQVDAVTQAPSALHFAGSKAPCT